MNLSPLPAHAIDRRLVRHLLPGEEVLWQGAPAPGSIVSRFAPLTTGLTAVVGILFVLGFPPGLFEWIWSVVHSVPQANINIAAEQEDGARIIIGWFLFITSVLGFFVMAYTREKHWVYAITRQRLLALNHGKVRHSATREDVDRVRTLHKPFRGDIVYWSSPTYGFRGQKEPQKLQELIESWRKINPVDDETREMGRVDGSDRTPTHPSSDADRASSRGFWIEKKPAVWMAFVGLVGAFGYWGYTSFLSGHEIASLELRENTPYDRPADMASLPEGLPAGYWGGPLNLDPVDNPMRAVLSMAVSRGRERVNYRLVLLDDAGEVAWNSSGVAQRAASDEDKKQDRSSSIRTKRMRHAIEPFTIERVGRYTLLADIERVENPRVALRGNVTAASALVYAVFGVIGLIGLGLLVREELERRRALG
jgi:hypothetical protein